MTERCGWTDHCDAPADDHRHQPVVGDGPHASGPWDMPEGKYRHPFIPTPAQPGRSARDGVEGVMSHELEKALAGIEQNIETMLATSYHRRQAERIRDLVRLAIALAAALATPPPAPEGERCRDCGEPLKAAVHDPLFDPEVWGFHAFVPLPPTPAAAVSVSALVEALDEQVERNCFSFGRVSQKCEAHWSDWPKGDRPCDWKVNAQSALAAARDTGARS